MELWRSNFENRRRSWVAPSVMGGSGRPPSVVLLDDGGTRTAEAYYCFLLSADVTIPFFSFRKPGPGSYSCNSIDFYTPNLLILLF
ncbi:hypothetical protein QL285_011549 [Trifolium repens]|nr:hypothetical protein QL285_011549 [Trifolium repens]